MKEFKTFRLKEWEKVDKKTLERKKEFFDSVKKRHFKETEKVEIFLDLQDGSWVFVRKEKFYKINEFLWEK